MSPKKRKKSPAIQMEKRVQPAPAKKPKPQPKPQADSYLLCPYDELFPDQAAEEYETLRVMDQDDKLVDDYTLIEYICSNPDCNCQQAVISVVAHSTHETMAALDVDFSRKVKVGLNSEHPQSDFAETLLKLISEHKFSDPAYINRLKAHYRQLKRAAADPTPEQEAVLQKYRT